MCDRRDRGASPSHAPEVPHAVVGKSTLKRLPPNWTLPTRYRKIGPGFAGKALMVWR